MNPYLAQLGALPTQRGFFTRLKGSNQYPIDLSFGETTTKSPYGATPSHKNRP